MPIEGRRPPSPLNGQTTKKSKEAEKPEGPQPRQPAKRQRVGPKEVARPAQNGERRDPEEDEGGGDEVVEIELEEDGGRDGDGGGGEDGGVVALHGPVEAAPWRSHPNKARPRGQAQPSPPPPPRVEPQSTAASSRVAPSPPAAPPTPSRPLRPITSSSRQRFSSLDPPEEPTPVRRKLRSSTRRKAPRPISPTFLEALAADAPPRSATHRRTPTRQISPFAGTESWMGEAQVLRAQSPPAVRPSVHSHVPGGDAAESSRASPTERDVEVWIVQGGSPLPANRSTVRASGSEAAALRPRSRSAGRHGSSNTETVLNATSTGGAAPIATGLAASDTKRSTASPLTALRGVGIRRVPSRRAVNGNKSVAGAGSDRASLVVAGLEASIAEEPQVLPRAPVKAETPHPPFQRAGGGEGNVRGSTGRTSPTVADSERRQASLPTGDSDFLSTAPEDEPSAAPSRHVDSDDDSESDARASTSGGLPMTVDREDSDTRESPSSTPARVDKGKGKAREVEASPPPSLQVRSRSESMATAATTGRSPSPSSLVSRASSVREARTSASPDARWTGGAASSLASASPAVSPASGSPAARPSGVSGSASGPSPELSDLDDHFDFDHLSPTANAFRHYKFEEGLHAEALATLTPRQRRTIERWKYPSSGRKLRFSGPQNITPLAEYRPDGSCGLLLLPPRSGDFEGEAGQRSECRAGGRAGGRASKRQAGGPSGWSGGQVREKARGGASERQSGGRSGQSERLAEKKTEKKRRRQ